MTQHTDAHLRAERPICYQIRVRGHLDAEWAGWFDNLTIELDDQQNTLLCGPVADQAALYGLINKLRDLGLTLLAVTCLGSVCSQGDLKNPNKEGRE